MINFYKTYFLKPERGDYYRNNNYLMLNQNNLSLCKFNPLDDDTVVLARCFKESLIVIVYKRTCSLCSFYA